MDWRTWVTKKPTEISLKYKYNGNSTVVLLVDPIENVAYRWQYCKEKTADWETIDETDQNSFVVTNTKNGDKYRCLAVRGKKVVAYSRTLTICQEDYQTENSDDSRAGHSRQNEKSDQSPWRSIEDTDRMSGLEFEQFCADILRKNGFSDVRVTQGSGDYGIDVLAKKESVTYAIQCKCYAGTVGNKAVQEAYSGKSFYNCMVAVVITNSFFTDAAIETARKNSVVLWNRNVLAKMIQKVYSDHSAQQDRERERQEQAERERERQEQERQSQEWQRKYWEEHNRRQQEAKSAVPDFFKGCSSLEQVKTRYRELMQIYHPDHVAGDVEYAKIINAQYEKMKAQYGR